MPKSENSSSMKKAKTKVCNIIFELYLTASFFC